MEKNSFNVDLVPLRRLQTALIEPDSPPGRILQAAEDMFAAKGFKATTTRAIAENADVNIATIHYYWGSKNELWHAVIYNTINRITELTRGVLKEKTDNPAGQIRDIIGRLVDIFADNPNYARLLLQRTLQGVSPKVAKVLAMPILHLGLDFINKHKITGPAAKENPAMALFCLQGALRIFFHESDSVKVIFGEDPAALSPAFRKQLKNQLTTLAFFLAGVDEKGGKAKA